LLKKKSVAITIERTVTAVNKTPYAVRRDRSSGFFAQILIETDWI